VPEGQSVEMVLLEDGIDEGFEPEPKMPLIPSSSVPDSYLISFLQCLKRNNIALGAGGGSP
jgi:hypothetical protein